MDRDWCCVNPWYLKDFFVSSILTYWVTWKSRCVVLSKASQSLILEQAFIYGVGIAFIKENARNMTTALPLGTSRSSFSSKCQTSLQGQALRIIKTSTHRPKTANKMEGFNMSLSDFLDIFPHFSYQSLHLFVPSKALWNCVNLWSFWKVDTQHLNNSWRPLALANLEKSMEMPWFSSPPLATTSGNSGFNNSAGNNLVFKHHFHQKRSFFKKNSCETCELQEVGSMLHQDSSTKPWSTCLWPQGEGSCDLFAPFNWVGKDNFTCSGWKGQRNDMKCYELIRNDMKCPRKSTSIWLILPSNRILQPQQFGSTHPHSQCGMEDCKWQPDSLSFPYLLQFTKQMSGRRNRKKP